MSQVDPRPLGVTPRLGPGVTETWCDGVWDAREAALGTVTNTDECIQQKSSRRNFLYFIWMTYANAILGLAKEAITKGLCL